MANQLFEAERNRREAQQQVGDGLIQAARRKEQAAQRRMATEAGIMIKGLMDNGGGVFGVISSGEKFIQPEQKRKILIDRWRQKVAKMKADGQAYLRDLR